MTSKTEIANWALLKLGAGRISNIDTESDEKARILKSIYEPVRDSLLQKYPWKFCLKRDALTPDTDAPAWGYAYQYTVPSDYLALRSIEDDPEYTLEDGKILTDAGTSLYIRYHRRVTTEASFHPLFVEAFVCKLAWEACERITQSSSKKDDMTKQFSFAINEAFTADAIEASMEELPESSWLEARV